MISNLHQGFIILIFIIQSAVFSIWNKCTQGAGQDFLAGRRPLFFAFWSLGYYLF